jgi:hypothetical protein
MAKGVLRREGVAESLETIGGTGTPKLAALAQALLERLEP